MNHQYAICITGCNIIDEKHTKEPLKKGSLLRVLDVSEQTENCSIKIFSDGNTVIEFNKTIHTCEFKNIRIVPQNLFLFLINADYEGRLNILKNEKTILELGVGSKVKLKFINSDKSEYTIEFVINYIGAIKTLGIGNFIGLNFAHFGALRDFGSILTKIHEQFYHICDEVTSIIVVRVEQLFTDIELYDLLRPNRERESMMELSLLDNTIENMSTRKISNVPEMTSQYKQDQNKSIKSMDVDQQFSTKEALDQVKPTSSVQCQTGNVILGIEDPPKKIQHFLRVQEYSKTKNENDYPTREVQLSKRKENEDNKKWYRPLRNHKKEEFSEKEKKCSSCTSCNKIEIRICKGCRTRNSYAAQSCISCRRPLGSD